MYGEGKTRGNVSIIKAPMATNQACCNILLNKEIADFEYVYIFFKKPSMKISGIYPQALEKT